MGGEKVGWSELGWRARWGSLWCWGCVPFCEPLAPLGCRLCLPVPTWETDSPRVLMCQPLTWGCRQKQRHLTGRSAPQSSTTRRTLKEETMTSAASSEAAFQLPQRLESVHQAPPLAVCSVSSPRLRQTTGHRDALPSNHGGHSTSAPPQHRLEPRS